MNKKMGGRNTAIMAGAISIVITMLYTATAMAGVVTTTSSGEITSAATLVSTTNTSVEGSTTNTNIYTTNSSIASQPTAAVNSQPTAITNMPSTSSAPSLNSGYQDLAVNEVSSYEIYEGSCTAILSTPYGSVKSSVSAYDSSFAALMCRKLADAVEGSSGHFFVRGYVYASSYNTPYISINSIGGSAD